MKALRPLLYVLLAFQLSSTALAKDFVLHTLPQAENPTFDLNKYKGKKTYYNVMENVVAPAILKLAQQVQDIKEGDDDDDTKEQDSDDQEIIIGNDRTVLESGGGISVRLDDRNYNVHINYPKGPRGGRSFGWTEGKVGDWSDAMYLQFLAEVNDFNTDADQKQFYTTIMQMLTASDASGLSKLKLNSERVATNFLAIYSAEEYRAMVPKPFKNWDDALLQTTLLGAFHGGQKKFTMIYMGKFRNRTKKQAAGVYFRGKKGQLFDNAPFQNASMKDYWQFSHKPDSRQSGINITRNDFQKMGELITKWEAAKGNKNLAKIFKIIGAQNQSNVFRTIAQHFVTDQAELKQAKALTTAVVDFMMDIRKDAQDITDSIEVENFEE